MRFALLEAKVCNDSCLKIGIKKIYKWEKNDLTALLELRDSNEQMMEKSNTTASYMKQMKEKRDPQLYIQTLKTFSN
jgi:hypothetical protein